jgi:hypothetical protein
MRDDEWLRVFCDGHDAGRCGIAFQIGSCRAGLPRYRPDIAADDRLLVAERLRETPERLPDQCQPSSSAWFDFSTTQLNRKSNHDQSPGARRAACGCVLSRLTFLQRRWTFVSKPEEWQPIEPRAPERRNGTGTSVPVFLSGETASLCRCC